MCGIVAVVGKGAAGDCRAALSVLQPRGPDGSGVWRSPSGAALLGHTRLAIQDLSDAAAQPMERPGPIALTYNGEIYNAPALRRELEQAGETFRSSGDTEVVLQGLRRWGSAGALERMCGMFAFAAWDEQRGELTAAVDPAGMKPLCWTMQNGSLYLASTCDALLALLPRRPGLDADGLCHVLCHGYCPPPMTVWQGIRKLGPGQALRYNYGDASPTVWQHWLPLETCDPSGADASPDAFGSLWEQVVREHTLSDVPVGLFLSGGFDSTAVALALADAGRRVHCLTLALDSADSEAEEAAETAALLGMPHTSIGFGRSDAAEMLDVAAACFDEPQAYGATLTAAAVARAARPHAKVMLSGDGGDEAFAGYAWHRRPPECDAALASEHLSLRDIVASPDADGAARGRALASLASLSLLHAHLQAVFPRFHPAEAAAILAPLGPGYDERTYAAWASEHDRPELPWPRRGQRLDLLGFCAGSILPKMDRASMAVGLEVRSPYLDRRVLEWALRRPPESRGESKPVLRRYLAGRAPARVLSRPKQGFSLRLASDPWPEQLPWLRRTRLAEMMHPRWDRFVAPDAPYRSARIFGLCMIGAWLERRAA